MGTLPVFGVSTRLLAIAALVVLDPLGLFGSGAERMAQAQQVSPPPVESHDMPWEREFGPVEFARHFREYVRLIGGLQDRAVEASRRRGDFWTPDELRQLFRR